MLHFSVKSRPDCSHSMAWLGHFINVSCLLGCLLVHKVICYLQSHPNKPLMLTKQTTSSNRTLCIHLSANKSEEFMVENALESFQDASHGTKKVLRSSYVMEIQTFLGTACAWKVHRLFLPTNSSDAELRVLHKAILRVEQHRLLWTSIGVPTSKPTK